MTDATQDPELRAFHNRLRKLINIDRSQLIDAGVMSEDDSSGWQAFRAHPWRWFIRAGDEEMARVWAIMERKR